MNYIISTMDKEVLGVLRASTATKRYDCYVSGKRSMFSTLPLVRSILRLFWSLKLVVERVYRIVGFHFLK